MTSREMRQRGALGLLSVALVELRGALVVLLGARLGKLLGVLSFVDFPKFVDTRSFYDLVDHIHNNIHTSTYHRGVYHKACTPGNLVYT